LFIKKGAVLNLHGYKMGRSCGASFEFVAGNLLEESNGVPFEFFNGVNEKKCKKIFTKIYKI